MTKQAIMFYDGGCPLCSREVSHYRRLDQQQQVDWVDISTQAQRLEAHNITPQAAMERLHVLDSKGQIHIGTAAFVELWLRLPYYRWLGKFVRSFRLVAPLDLVYEPFARWRLARRRNDCPVRENA